MKSEIRIDLPHDRKGISLSTPNDVIYLSKDQADKLVSDIHKKTIQSTKRNPPAPEPVLWDGTDKELASTSECSERCAPCSINIGVYECSIEQAIEVRDFIESALKYHDKKHCDERTEIK